MSIQLPTGTKDLLPDEAAFWDHFTDTAKRVFGCYGYQPVVTPLIEQTNLFVRGIGTATDVVSKEMFTAVSGENLKKLVAGEGIDEKDRLSLRPEGTAGVVRAVVQHNLVQQGSAPVKLMYAGPMFRAERPQKGRLRQFNQVGIECLGAEEPSIDAEGIIMLMRFYEEIGIPRESMVLLLNSMGCENCRPAYRDAVHAYLEQHVDELCDDCRRRMDINPLRAFDCKKEGCIRVMESAPRITDYLCDDCKAHHQAVKGYLDAAGIAYVEDYKLVRGLDYYTRTVFEVQATDSASAQSAIGGGGRYDKLAEEVGGKPTPGFGFALGFERCVIALEAAGATFTPPRACEVFVACVSDDERPTAFSLVQNLRAHGVKTDMSHQKRSLKSQFKLANKLNARYVVTLGPDEVAASAATLRNMDTHEEESVAFADMPARAAELVAAGE